MGASAAARRARAIEDFAAVLTELRESVGTPSFRTMAGHSHAISHTTLHEAVKGNRLPSWSTTVEFVKACGADPAEYRDRWEQASAAIGCATAGSASPGAAVAAARVPHQATVSAVVGRGGTAVLDSAAPPSTAVVAHRAGAERPTATQDEGELVEASAADPVDEAGAAADGGRPRGRRVAVLLTAAGVVLLTGGTVLWTSAHHAEATAAPSTGPTAADCPVRQQNPPPAPPLHAGDRAAYVADVTMADCSHVARAQTVRKVWRFKNAGTVPWRGYALHRVDAPQRRDQCQTITDVPVADTAPGGLVDITVDVATPPRAGFCFVRFKMVDAQGRVAFPGSRPVNFQVVVD